MRGILHHVHGHRSRGHAGHGADRAVVVAGFKVHFAAFCHVGGLLRIFG